MTPPIPASIATPGMLVGSASQGSSICSRSLVFLLNIQVTYRCLRCRVGILVWYSLCLLSASSKSCIPSLFFLCGFLILCVVYILCVSTGNTSSVAIRTTIASSCNIASSIAQQIIIAIPLIRDEDYPNINCGFSDERAKVREFLGSKINLQIATIDKNGDPIIQPVWYYHDPDDDKIFVISGKSSQKVANIRRKNIFTSI